MRFGHLILAPTFLQNYCPELEFTKRFLVPVLCVYVIGADVWAVAPSGPEPLWGKTPSCASRIPTPRGGMQSTSRERSGGGAITTKEGSAKNPVLSGGHGTAGTKGVTLVPRDPSRALPGWHGRGFGYFPTTEGELHSESSHQQPSPPHVTLRFRVCPPFIFS